MIGKVSERFAGQLSFWKEDTSGRKATKFNHCDLRNSFFSKPKIALMTIIEFISGQLPERRQILNDIHEIIIQTDLRIDAKVEPMMGREMIVYKAAGTFKYGLSSVKNNMSLHLMSIYVSAALHSRYRSLLPAANFQKGCINFQSEAEMPLAIVRQLVSDSSKIDLQKIREDYINSGKRSAKSKR